MKLKKVEISAFRIYDDPNDATFDLTTKSGNAAGFVSLYAPNGFGKTSFYDAVEYGMTESIDRFYLRVDELEKLANVQTIDKFIRHTNSNRNTYVKIYSDNDENPIIDRQFYKHGNQRHDLILNSRGKKEHSFQKVILSQEWISAFLTESDGETRYRKFMSNPELSTIDNYYNNLRHLLKALGNKKNDLNKALKGFEETIQNVSVENTLEKVNNQILMLKNDFNENSLSPLSLEATQKQVQRLQDTISGLLISQNKEVDLKHLLDHISTAKFGNDLIVGVGLYFALNEDQLKKSHRQEILLQIFKKFENLEQQQIILENKILSQSKYIAIKNDIEKSLQSFEEYLRVNTGINTKNEEIKIKEKDLQEANTQLEILNRRIIEDEGNVDLLIKQIGENTAKNSLIPETKKNIEKLNADISKLDDELIDNKAKLEGKTNDFRNTIESSLQYERILQEIQNAQYPTITPSENSELFDLVQNLKSWEIELLNKKIELKLIEDSIAENQNLNQTITDFIKAGLSILNERQSSSCPLCEQVYNSYDEIVKKITDNKALDSTIKELLERKTIIDANIVNVSNLIYGHRDTLSLNYKTKFDQDIVKAKLLESSINEINISVKGVEKTLDSFRQERDKLISLLGGISIDEYRTLINKNILELTNRRNDLNSVLGQDQDERNNIVGKIESFQKQITLLIDEIENLGKSEEYIYVVDWFKDNAAGEYVSKNKLVEEEEVYTKIIFTIIEEIKDYEKIIDDLKKELDFYNKDNLYHEKTELERDTEQITSRIKRYQNYIKDILKIDISGLNETALNDLLKEKQQSVNLELDSNKKLLDEYQKLHSYCQNIWTFLRSENTKIEADKAKKQLDFLETEIEPLIQGEYNSSKKYLETKIKNFFHVDLINELYKKIDPHPDFKSVEFKANFDDENPRLDVFVRKTNDENLLVPNLYFSTAQINILSLSIFLASALKQTEYKCIFIDDPIQSMDNINVLSTIDLLRSIVVNEGRQIILSTHDENFHNLLKKKMPPELFDSKFLELESFGKVKSH